MEQKTSSTDSNKDLQKKAEVFKKDIPRMILLIILYAFQVQHAFLILLGSTYRSFPEHSSHFVQEVYELLRSRSYHDVHTALQSQGSLVTIHWSILFKELRQTQKLDYTNADCCKKLLLFLKCSLDVCNPILFVWYNWRYARE